MPLTTKGVKLYAIPKVAKCLRVTPQTIRAFIRAERLKVVRIGRSYSSWGETAKDFLNQPPANIGLARLIKNQGYF